MSISRWSPGVPLNRREKFLVGRMVRTGKLFAFLRMHRHELFDDAFQAELETMYRESGEGKEAVAPALLAMAVLLQAYTGASDAMAVELTIVDARWQMVLGVLGEDKPPFSQGALPAFRQRLIAHDMDRRILERTVELARRTHAPSRAPVASRTPSTCSRAPRARSSRARHGWQISRRRRSPVWLARPCSRTRASRRRSTSSGAHAYPVA